MLVIALKSRSALDCAASPAFLPSHPHDEVEVEILEEDFVEETRLLASVCVVLFTDSFHVEATYAPKACNGAAGSVFAFVAVNHDWVVRAVHEQAQSSLHFAGVDAHCALVRANVHTEVLNAGFVHERLVLRSDGLRDQSKDALDFEILDEFVIFGLGIAATVDTARHHGAIIQGWNAHVQAIRHNGSNGRRCDSAGFSS